MFRRKKKGFTLVEMLVVIAIIAILVSITIPIVGKSVAKSAAATNAANLRAIEGKIATMRVENPDAFNSAVDRLGESLELVIKWIPGAETILGWADITTEEASQFIISLFGGKENLEEFFNSNNSVGSYLNYKILHQTASDEGVITIPVDPAIVLEDVPAAKAVKTGTMEIEEGTPMTVFISQNGVVATYEYNGQSYTREDFAKVAETGTFEGTGSGGLTEDVANAAIQCELGNHVPVDSKTCLCKYCGAVVHADPQKDQHHNCAVEGCGAQLHANCIDENGDYSCDYLDCDKGVHPTSWGQIQHIGSNGQKCQVPGCNYWRCPCTDAHSPTGFMGIPNVMGECTDTRCGHIVSTNHEREGITYGACTVWTQKNDSN